MLEQPAASVIIPVLDDTTELTQALDTVGRHARVEVVVVNGGKPDATFTALERSHPDVVWLRSSAGRGRQMNVGASHAQGAWLVFLHADTRLPGGWLEELESVRCDPTIVGGSFRFRLDSPSRWARAIERGVAARVRWLNLPYGDQGLFVRREVFESLGGYRDMALMEDVEFVRRLSRAGRLHHSVLPAVTSARRWECEGWIRQSAENVTLTIAYLVGVSPERLARRYRRRGAVRT
jgi:hypothetical protein